MWSIYGMINARERQQSQYKHCSLAWLFGCRLIKGTIYCYNSFLHSVIIVISKRPFIQNQYFQDTPLAQWSFDSYLDYTNKRQSRKSKNIALLNNFHNQLINMKQKKNLANNVKVHIENILSKIDYFTCIKEGKLLNRLYKWYL